MAFLVAALTACALAAAAGTFRLVQLGFVPAAQGTEVFAKWMIGDFIGVITLVPLLLVRIAPGLRHYLAHGRWSAPGRRAHFGDASSTTDLKTILIVALVGPAISPYPEHIAGKVNTAARFLPPSKAHWFGTNELGQDVLTLVLAGTRVSVLAALAVVVLGAFVGTVVGAIAGYAGGWTDEILMRFADLKLTVPGLILAMAVAAAVTG